MLVVHFYEAILAGLAILIWHLYSTVFNPDVYPMNPSWLTGKMPVLHLRQGRRRDELLDLINEDQGISVLVLGTAVGHEDPGPLATYLIGQMGRDMRLPIILVPGHLSDADIDVMT